MTDNEEPTLVSIGDAGALIAAVATLVAGSTATIMSRLDENTRGATERWRLHDAELERNLNLIAERFVKLEEALDAHLVVANVHFSKDHDDDIRMDARIRPVRIGAAWLVGNWRSILLLAFGLLGFLAVLADILTRYLGGTT